MDTWHGPFLGLRELPHEISPFELQAFFTFSEAERAAIEERRQPAHKLGLALQIGFLRLSGRPLKAFRIVPANLLRHLGTQLAIEVPDLASLRALYRRGRTLYDHQQLACELLGFQRLSEHQRRSLVRILRDEWARRADRDHLVAFARRWLYEHRLLIVHDRALRTMITAAATQLETELAHSIQATVGASLLARWRGAITQTHRSGLTLQTWLWAAPARYSSRQIGEVIERIRFLYALDVHRHLTEVPEALLRRYARRLAGRKPAVAARIQEPARTVEVACFLRHCLLVSTDQLILMVRRRVAELGRQAAAEVPHRIDWAHRYRELLGQLSELAANPILAAGDLRQHLVVLVATHEARRPPSRAQFIRARLVEAVRPVRSLLRALVELPWQATGQHPVIDALGWLRELYGRRIHRLPDEVSVQLGSVWRTLIASNDREQAFRALEVATLLGLRRALRNGSVWIAHSFAFRSRDQLFLPEERWQSEQRRHYLRLALPHSATAFLDPLLERVRQGLEAVARAARDSVLRIDDELHLTALAADEQDPEVLKLRATLDRGLGEVQLPELILAVDAQVRFSWIMLGREPRSADELLMVYAGLLAHGTSLSAAETARMIPPLSALAVRQAMRWAADERRLAEASTAVLAFMHRHPIVANWGRADLASSDRMSLETSQRIWLARLDPRRKTPAIGLYTHVRDRWGIFYAQPIVLHERQAGAAIEGVVRQERLDIAQLAVDTHGYTDFAMALARLLGFDLCPRLKALKQRRLYVPRGFDIPEALKPIAVANVDLERIHRHWDELVRLAASVHTGYASAVDALARFGAAARGDPLYEAGVQLGRLLRTVFLCDYFVNSAFRRELLRVLNRGEAVNALKQALYAGRVAGYQAKRDEEMRAVADALSLLANLVMAWNTTQMQAVIDGWSEPVSAELIGRIVPTRIEGINLRGIFRFPIGRFADRLLPSSASTARAAPTRWGPDGSV